MNFLIADMLLVLLETNLLFVASSFMISGTAAWAVISKETRLNPSAVIHTAMYVVGSRSFRPDIQKPRQMENAVRDI
jgi:hypothetical protein